MKNLYVEPSVRVIDLETEAVMLGGSQDGKVSGHDPIPAETQKYFLMGEELNSIW